MRRRAGNFRAVGEHRLVHVVAVHAHAAERRDERRVNIDDSLRERAHNLRAHDRQIARQHDQIGLRRLQLPENHVVKRLARARLLLAHKRTGDTVFPRALQRVHLGGVRKHQHDFPVDLPRLYSVNDRLQVAAAAGAEHCDSGTHRSTSLSPSSPVLTTAPIL